MKSRIADPQLDWDEKGNPVSQLHRDTYYSRDDGLAESRHVFLEGNHLSSRFAALHPGDEFVVGETGFGTGLNFLLTWQLFRQQAPAGAHLLFISLEGYPMNPTQLERALRSWPQLAEQSRRLVQAWPARIGGFHLLELEQGIDLLLVFDRVDQGLAELMPQPDRRNAALLPRPVDAWFLDGFAPSRNPDMWSQSVLAKVAQLSHAGTSFATFSVAGAVRRGLAQVGFDCQAVAGFGRKREMLIGSLGDALAALPDTAHSQTGKYHQVWHREPSTQPAAGRPAIIGGGIAGLTLGIALNRLGIGVDLYEVESRLAALTSGNPQAAIFARLSTERGELEDFAQACLAYACRYYQPFWQQGFGQQCGILQLPRNQAEAERMQKLAQALPAGNAMAQWRSAGESSEIAGIALATGTLHLPGAGWIQARALVQCLHAFPNNQFFTGEAPAVQAEGSGWLVQSGGQERHYQQLVLCTGVHAGPDIPGLEALDRPIQPVGGQVSLVSQTADSGQLRSILCQRNYLTPASDGCHSVGASYRLQDSKFDIRTEDDRENLDFLKPFGAFDATTLAASRVGVRATTPDYLPLCGPVPDFAELANSHGYLSRDARQLKPVAITSLPGLYCFRGLGSRGFTYAPLCALHLARQLTGLASPLPDHLQRAIHPARFAIRDIIRSS